MSNVTAASATDLTAILQTAPYYTLVTEDVNNASVVGGYISDNVISFSIYNGGAVSYFWDFGDGDTQTTSTDTTTHTYAGDGTYTVSVQVGVGGVTLTSTVTTFVGGVTTDPENHWAVWFKYTARTGDAGLGLNAYAISGADYRPYTTIWLGPDTAPVQYLAGIAEAGHNQPMQFPIDGGITYYIKVEADAFSVWPFTDLQLYIRVGPQVLAPIDSIFIPNDTTTEFPGTVLSADTGEVLQFRTTTAGEEAHVLPSGIFAIVNDDEPVDPLAVVIYSPEFVEIASVVLFPDEAGINSITGNGADTFYVSHRKTAVASTLVKTVSAAGVEGPDSWTLPSVATTIAVNYAETILYYSEGAAGGPVGGGSNPIQRWDLVNDIALADLVPALNIAGDDYYVGADLFVMADGNILALYGNVGDATGVYFARIMTTAGATVRDITYTPISSTIQAGPRMALASDDPVSFWVWSSSPIGGGEYTSRFTRFSAVDGSTITTFDRPVFEDGIGPAGAGNDPDLPVIGNAFSCPIFVLRQALAPAIASEPLAITSIENTFTGSTTNPMNCERPIVQRLTMTGTGFDANAVLTGTDPLGEALILDVSSVTSTAISFTFSTMQYGQFCFTVTNPDGVTARLCILSTSCTDPVTMRRLRRAAHLSDENQWTFYKSFTLDYEAGVGLNSGQGSDPEILLRWSDDGGHQWSDYHPMKIGKMGKYTHRAIWRRLGRSRKRLFEVVCTDPVKLVLLDAFLDIESGTS